MTNGITERFDLTGQRFGRLVVLAYAASKRNRRTWTCRCDCGRGAVVSSDALRGGRTVSCGCRQASVLGDSTRTHGGSRTPVHRVWNTMKYRCYNPNSPEYPYYGGRGIQVCERWQNSFAAFRSDMGPRPAGGSIDRIDPDGNYEPGNCRWATQREQVRNSRAAKLCEEDARAIRCARAVGVEVVWLARLYGVNRNTIAHVASGRSWM